MAGAFCISLDFEKYWGVHDVLKYEDYAKQLKQVDKVVEQLLKVFSEHQIHATWAIVGLLLEDQEELLKHQAINYAKKAYSPFPIQKAQLNQIEPQCRLAGEQAKLINQTAHQELASHTYSHFYALEDGVTIHDFEEDCRRMKKCEAQLGVEFESIVFPRNQINEEMLTIAQQFGIKAFRGNQLSRLWSNSKFEDESLLKRGQRYADAYFKVAATKEYSIEELPIIKGLVNVPASRFFKPIGKSKFLEKKKLKQILDEMTYAAKNNKVYHLWWHPHNFGNNTAQHFVQLAEILHHFNVLRTEFDFQSLTMKEIAELRNG